MEIFGINYFVNINYNETIMNKKQNDFLANCDDYRTKITCPAWAMKSYRIYFYNHYRFED